jgi:hypothetical protein
MNDMTTLGFAMVLVGALATQTTLLLVVTGKRIKAFDQRLGQKIDGLDQRLSEKIDGVARHGSVDHRLDSLEADVLLIKRYLLSTTAA